MTPDQVKTLAAALAVPAYSDPGRSSDVLNAQHALAGRTHYVDPQTLRYFKARIVGARTASCGAFFKVTETVAADCRNSRRGYRVALFDLLGRQAYSVSIEAVYSTRAQAEKAFESWYGQFDEKEHYRKVLQGRAASIIEQLASITDARESL